MICSGHSSNVSKSDGPAGPPTPVELGEAAGDTEPSLRAVLASKRFRAMYVGSTVASLATWFRMVVVVAWAYDATDSATFVGQITFATLCPVLLFGVVGGVLADRVDRRKLLLWLLTVQALICSAFAVVVRADTPNHVLVLALSFALGTCTAGQQPAYMAILPNLVGRAQLPAAISLQSVQTNATRIIGPVLAGVMFAAWGPVWVLLASGLSLVVSVFAVLRVEIQPRQSFRSESVRKSLATTAYVARTDPVVRRSLIVITLFSSVSLLFVNQMPVVASENLGVALRSTTYAIFYGSFGVGAVLGSLASGTVLLRLGSTAIVRWGLVGFGVTLVWLALARQPVVGIAAALFVGMTYMVMSTSLTTAFQVRLHDGNRGQLSAIWQMGYVGAVAISNLALGPVVDVLHIAPVMVGGALMALMLAPYADLRTAQPVLIWTDRTVGASVSDGT